MPNPQLMNQQVDDHLTIYHVRPRFEIQTTQTVEQLTNKIQQSLKKDNASCKGKIIPGFVTLFLPKADQHYWSPELHLNLEEIKEGTNVRGLYGPRPAVWSMFVFFYFLIALATMVIGIVGFSNLSLGKPAAILWLIPVLIVVFLSLYLVAYFGKRMGKDQMSILHRFLEESTGLEI